MAEENMSSLRYQDLPRAGQSKMLFGNLINGRDVSVSIRCDGFVVLTVEDSSFLLLKVDDHYYEVLGR